ncbi:MAG: TatD family hydrolase [Bacteroidales bacterium]|nr:TatD family hydrolase [Bacteroidales bacterium]
MLIDFHTHTKVAEGVVTPRAFGLHPWHLSDSYRDTPLAAFEEAEMVGECGLDYCCTTDRELQREAFEWQIAIAERLRKPVVVHCVRAQEELLRIRHTWRGADGKRARQPWVVHGFIGNSRQAAELLRAGIQVSIGAALLDSRREKVRNTVAWLGASRLLLETDMDTCGIRQVYEAAADILHNTVEELADAIKEVYAALFMPHND